MKSVLSRALQPKGRPLTSTNGDSYLFWMPEDDRDCAEKLFEKKGRDHAAYNEIPVRET